MLLPTIHIPEEMYHHRQGIPQHEMVVLNQVNPVRISSLDPSRAIQQPVQAPAPVQQAESKESIRQREKEAIKKLEMELIDNINSRITHLMRTAEKEGSPYDDYDLEEAACYFQVICVHSTKSLIRLLIHKTNNRLNDHGGWESTGVRCAIMACEYLRRSKHFLMEDFLGSFFFTAFMLAFKNNDDETLPLTFFSDIADFEPREARLMELSMCAMMDWRLAMSNVQYQFTRNLILPESVRTKS